MESPELGLLAYQVVQGSVESLCPHCWPGIDWSTVCGLQTCQHERRRQRWQDGTIQWGYAGLATLYIPGLQAGFHRFLRLSILDMYNICIIFLNHLKCVAKYFFVYKSQSNTWLEMNRKIECVFDSSQVQTHPWNVGVGLGKRGCQWDSVSIHGVNVVKIVCGVLFCRSK